MRRERHGVPRRESNSSVSHPHHRATRILLRVVRVETRRRSTDARVGRARLVVVVATDVFSLVFRVSLFSIPRPTSVSALVADIALPTAFFPNPALSPLRRSGKAGYVYKLGLRNGKANIDEYAPIYDPNEFKTDGDKYEGDIKLAALAVVGVVGSGALAILLTSSL